MYEIEMKFKFKTQNIEDILTKFRSLNIKFSVPIVQKDQIFLHKELQDYKIIEGTKVFRIREESINNLNLKYILTLKVQQEQILESKEFETDIKNKESIELMLEELGFKRFVQVEKKRIKGILDNYNLCIDEVKDLGLFLEVEYMSKTKVNAEQVQSSMIQWVKELDLGDYELNTVPYDTQMYQKSK